MEKFHEGGLKMVNKVNKNTLLDQKTKAVELWRETRGHISNICRALDISRTTFYNWMNEDVDFSRSLLDAESELNDDVRDALIQKVADGDMQAITFYLKNRHPDFKPQPTTLQQINIGEGKDGNSITFVNFKDENT